jgi:hypothetical protein
MASTSFSIELFMLSVRRAVRESRALATSMPTWPRLGELDAGLAEALRDFVAARGEGLENGLGCFVRLRACRLGLHHEAVGEARARLGERGIDAVGRFGERIVDARRHALDVDAEALMRAADGFAQARSVRHDRVALALQFVDKRAHAQFVFVIGALERGDFAAHHGFEFGGAGDCALDAVAEGGDFAADGLAHAHDGIGRDAFGLGEAQRDFRHRARDEAHFLGAPDGRGDGEEHYRRQNQRGKEQPEIGEVDQSEQAVGLRNVLIGARIADHERHDDPPGRGDGGDIDGGERRPCVQRAENLADRLTVVIGRRLGGATALRSAAADAWGLLGVGTGDGGIACRARVARIAARFVEWRGTYPLPPRLPWCRCPFAAHLRSRTKLPASDPGISECFLPCRPRLRAVLSPRGDTPPGPILKWADTCRGVFPMQIPSAVPAFRIRGAPAH